MIVCVGTTPVWQRSMVFEHLHLNEVNRAAGAVDYASGKSINVARVSASSAGTTSGRPGSSAGTPARRSWRTCVGTAFAAASCASTPRHRQCITVIDRSNGTATELVEEAARVDNRTGSGWERGSTSGCRGRRGA